MDDTCRHGGQVGRCERCKAAHEALREHDGRAPGLEAFVLSNTKNEPLTREAFDRAAAVVEWCVPCGAFRRLCGTRCPVCGSADTKTPFQEARDGA